MSTRQMGSRSFTRALALALNEWILMLLLFVNSVFSYMITRFADYSNLQSPCLMCSRLDHIFKKQKSYWDMICSKHKSEISQTAVAKQEMLPKIGNVRTVKQSKVKKSVSFNHLPHVGYTELKFHSDTESEAVFSEDEGLKFRTKDIETSLPVITLPYDLATDKLLNVDLPLKEEEDNLILTSRAMEHFEADSKQEEEVIQLQDSSLPSDFKNDSFMVETELISLNDVTSTSEATETHEYVSKEIDLMSLHDVCLDKVPESLTTFETNVEKSKENPADSSELISFNDVTLTSVPSETHEDVSKRIDVMSLHDISLDEAPESFTTNETFTAKSKENPADSSLMEETELISLNDVTSTSSTAETHIDVSKEIDLTSLHEISLDKVPEKSKENPAHSSLVEETELISLNDVNSTSDPSETHEDVSKEIDLMSLHDIFQEEVPESLTTIENPVAKSKQNPAEAELISLNDVTSISDPAKTHEYVSNGIDLLSLHDISLEEVPESLTTIETIVGKSKENLAASELISLDDVTSTSEATQTHEDVSKGIDIMSLHDISLEEVPESFTTNETFTAKSKENPADSSELISFNDVTSTSGSVKTHEDVSKEIDLISLHDISIEEVPQSLTTIETNVAKSKQNPAESELISFNDVTSTSDAAKTHEDVSKEIDVMSLHDISLEEVPKSLTKIETTIEKSKENPADSCLLEESELINFNDVTTTSITTETLEDVSKETDLMSLPCTSLDEVPRSLTKIETSVEKSKENPAHSSLLEETELISLNDVTSTSDASETHEDVSKDIDLISLHDVSLAEVPESLTTTETSLEKSKEEVTNQVDIASLESEYIIVSPSKSTKSTPENSTKNCELLDLADAYNIIVTNEGNKGEQIEQWMKKDTHLKTLLTQISASREISPKISDQDTNNLDYDMQLLLQRKMLERNESNLSLEGVSVTEIEGENESDRLRRQVDHDRKLLTGLYKELEEERSASAIATNQAMAMITRLQEEKAMFQMEALQNLRMMEEQSEYDMEAIQRLNDLLVEREKVIQDLEAEIEYFRDQTP